MATQGIRDTNPLRADWPELLKGLHTGDGRPIPPRLAAELIREWRRLQLVIEMIVTVESEREQTDSESAAGVKIELLRRLRGIGPIFATVLTREVFYRNFINRREIGSYVGLAPPIQQRRKSAGSGHQQSRQSASEGNSDRAGLAMVEASARKCAVAMVSRAGRHPARSNAEDHDRRRCAKADRWTLAISRDRHDSGRRRSQGLTEGMDDLRSPGRACDRLWTGQKAAR